MWPDSFLRRGGDGYQSADPHHIGIADLYHRAYDSGISSVLPLLEGACSTLRHKPASVVNRGCVYDRRFFGWSGDGERDLRELKMERDKKENGTNEKR